MCLIEDMLKNSVGKSDIQDFYCSAKILSDIEQFLSLRIISDSNLTIYIYPIVILFDANLDKKLLYL